MIRFQKLPNMEGQLPYKVCLWLDQVQNMLTNGGFTNRPDDNTEAGLIHNIYKPKGAE